MRDPKRIKMICHLLQKLWEKNPDLRFGQLVMSKAILLGDELQQAMFYQEDDETIELLQRMLDQQS